MNTDYFCKERKCTKRMKCARYIEGLRNKFNKQPDKVPKRDIKNCNDYIEVIEIKKPTFGVHNKNFNKHNI